MIGQINFPHLQIYLSHVGKSVSVFGFPIAYYGITMALSMLAGIAMACAVAKWTGQDTDTYMDLSIYAILFSLLGARIYYVIFQWDLYKDDLLSIFNLRQGGLALYGSVIGAIITVFIFTRKRKISFGQVLDTGGMGLLIGQILGRWGNFFNREVFGGYTDSLLAMELPVKDVSHAADITEEMMEHVVVRDGIEFIRVHPTFLYESLWNLALMFLLLIYWKRKKFNGEVFLLYLAGYGVGRFWIEGIRTDQLFLPGTQIPVSQLLAGIMVVVSVAWILIRRAKER